jgi:hypothetical protein
MVATELIVNLHSTKMDQFDPKTTLPTKMGQIDPPW